MRFSIYLHWNHISLLHRIGMEPIHAWHRTQVCITHKANCTVWTVSLTATQSNFSILKITVAYRTVWTSLKDQKLRFLIVRAQNFRSVSYHVKDTTILVKNYNKIESCTATQSWGSLACKRSCFTSDNTVVAYSYASLANTCISVSKIEVFSIMENTTVWGKNYSAEIPLGDTDPHEVPKSLVITYVVIGTVYFLFTQLNLLYF